MSNKFFVNFKKVPHYWKWQPWTQPVLTSYTSAGVITSCGDYADTVQAWRISDGIKSGTSSTGTWIGNPRTGGPWWVNWKLPRTLRISHIKFYNSYAYRAQNIQFFTDSARGTALTPLLVAPNTNWGVVESDVANIVTDNLFFYQTTCYSEYGTCGEIEITADSLEEIGTAQDYDEITYTYEPSINMVQPDYVPVAEGVTVYDVAGTYTFTVPANVTKVKIEAIGAGGGGGGWGASYYYERQTNGTSGGNGKRKELYLDVTPGQTYTVVVGAGGAKGSCVFADESYYYAAGNGVNGGTSSFGGTLLQAAGGAGGIGGSYKDTSTSA